VHYAHGYSVLRAKFAQDLVLAFSKQRAILISKKHKYSVYPCVSKNNFENVDTEHAHRFSPERGHHAGNRLGFTASHKGAHIHRVKIISVRIFVRGRVSSKQS
jgi:hypothetical protein